MLPTGTAYTDGEIGAAVIVVCALAAALVAGLIMYGRRKAAAYIPPRIVEIARISEDTRFTEGGGAALLLLLLFQVPMALGVMVMLNNSFGMAAVGTIWIAGNVLFCTGVIVGRKRTYTVTREEPPSDPPMN